MLHCPVFDVFSYHLFYAEKPIEPFANRRADNERFLSRIAFVSRPEEERW
jgi:hypothetical protein